MWYFVLIFAHARSWREFATCRFAHFPSFFSVHVDTYAAVSLYFLISSRLLSIHLRLGRPLLLFPGTTMSIIFLDMLSSSLLLICPYQFNRFCLRNVDIGHTLASSCMIWVLTWSFLVLPLIHRSILISATCNLFSSFSLIAKHSAPYVIVGLVTVLYTLSFSLMGTFSSHSDSPSAASISSKLV